MGEATDDIKLTSGSVIEISRLPGYILQTKGQDFLSFFLASGAYKKILCNKTLTTKKI